MQHVQNLLKSMNLRPGTFFASSRLPSPLGRPELVICIWKFCPGKPGTLKHSAVPPVYPLYRLCWASLCRMANISHVSFAAVPLHPLHDMLFFPRPGQLTHREQKIKVACHCYGLGNWHVHRFELMSCWLYEMANGNTPFQMISYSFGEISRDILQPWTVLKICTSIFTVNLPLQLPSRTKAP